MIWGNVISRVFIPLLVIGILSGCAGVQRGHLYGAGEYDTLISDFERSGGYASIQPGTGDGWSLFLTTCDSYFSLRNYAKLEECLAKFEAFRLPESSWLIVNDNDSKLFIYSRRAQVEIDFGNFHTAYELAQKAVDFYDISKGRTSESGQGTETWYVEAMRTLGVSAALKGDPGAAKQVADRLWNHSVQHLAQDFKTRVNRVLRNSVAAIHMARQDYPAVLATYENPLPKERINADRVFNAILTLGTSEIIDRAVEAAFEGWHVDKAFPQNFSLAKTYFELGQTDKARAALDEGLASPVAQNFSGYYSVMLHDRAQIAQQDGDLELAEKLLAQAIDVIESRRSTINAEAARIGFVGDKQAVYGDLIAHYVAQQKFDRAFDYAERAKARALVDLLATKRSFGGQAGAEAAHGLLAQVDQLEQPVIRLQNKGAAAADSSLRGLKIVEKIAAEQPELASLISVSTPESQKLQGLLGPKEALVEFYRHGDQLFVFVMRQGGITAEILTVDDLDQDVVALRTAVSHQNARNQSYQAPARALYAKLFEPIEEYIVGQELTIVPHGNLHYVPFAALIGPNGFMIEQQALRVLPSASVMSFLREPDQGSGQRDKLLVLGNPDLGDPTFDLPAAGQEARILANATPDAHLLLRAQASETVVKSTADQFRYLHFASHGTFQPDAPLSSALLLSPDASNDGYLTVSELYDLKLNADLVTLSACETALGKVAAGDDVVGFTRGFLYAGAQSIVSSLWQVEDKSTAELMVGFYDQMSVTDKRQALRRAQLAVKQEKPHPFFWAAFQLTGAVN